MKGDAKVIEYLNKALKSELTAINQYFLHGRILDSWGFAKLGQHEHAESIDEMKHADSLVQRILALEGLPNLQSLDKLYVGEDVEEIFRGDLTLEYAAHPLYKEAVGYCESCGDYVTRELMAAILASEERHIDWLETQLGLIQRLGLTAYLQNQM